jgi:hypothetical protein
MHCSYHLIGGVGRRRVRGKWLDDGSDQTATTRNVGSLGTIPGLQFGESIRNVVLDSSFGNHQLIGDLAVGCALRQ